MTNVNICRDKNKNSRISIKNIEQKFKNRKICVSKIHIYENICLDHRTHCMIKFINTSYNKRHVKNNCIIICKGSGCILSILGD